MAETNLHLISEEIFEKLNYINFQKKFLVQKNNGQKIPADFFLIEVNQTEQFEFFKNLVKWLLLQCRVDTSQLTSYSDPLSICTSIVSSAETLGFDPTEVTPVQLKQGFGTDVCKVLLFLLNKIFEEKKLQFKAP